VGVRLAERCDPQSQPQLSNLSAKVPTLNYSNTFLDRRLAVTSEPFRSGARPLAAGMRDEFITANSHGTPPVAVFVDHVRATWPDFPISDNVKAVAGMVVAEVLAPDYVPGRRKTAPRSSYMASGSLFVLSQDTTSIGDEKSGRLDDEAAFHVAREVLERAALMLADVKGRKVLTPRGLRHLRGALTALQVAAGEFE
jgi:hypothetical protein